MSMKSLTGNAIAAGQPDISGVTLMTLGTFHRLLQQLQGMWLTLGSVNASTSSQIMKRGSNIYSCTPIGEDVSTY